MLDSVIAYIGEVFLDAVIDKSQSIKISKKKRIIYTIIFLLITLFYVALFLIITHIAILNWNLDRSISIKMFAVSFILIITFLVYGKEIISKRKERKSEINMKQ